MQTPTENDIPLDDFEYDELESFLLDLESDAAVFNISEFDGFRQQRSSSSEILLEFKILFVLVIEDVLHLLTISLEHLVRNAIVKIERFVDPDDQC